MGQKSKGERRDQAYKDVMTLLGDPGGVKSAVVDAFTSAAGLASYAEEGLDSSDPANDPEDDHPVDAAGRSRRSALDDLFENQEG